MSTNRSAPSFYITYIYLIRQCFRYVGDMRDRYVWALILLTVAQCLFRLNPLFLGQFLNTLQENGPDVLRLAFFWLVLFFIFENIPWILWKPARQWERQSAFEMRQNFYDRHYHLLRHLPLKWHQDHHSGNTINRMRKASDTLFQFGQDQYEYLQRAANIVITISVLLWFSPVLAALAITCMICVIFLIKRYDQLLGPIYQQENELEHKFFEGFFDYVSSMMSVITLRLGERTQSDLNNRHNRIKPLFVRESRLNENKYLFLTLFVSTATALVLGGYTWLALDHGAIKIGTLVMLFQYFNTFTDSCYFLAWQIEKTTKWYNDFKGAEEILLSHPKDSKDAVAHPAWTKIDITDLSFSHVADGPLIINHIDLSIAHGQKIAVIGESGSGKSTLMAMMRGVYEPETGRLNVDGQACDDFHPLYDRITLIPQEPEVFENTIRHNLTLGIDYPDDQIALAVGMAMFESVLTKMPKGYDTDVREKGVNMSGGEKQRLALTRGLLAGYDSDILVMDEPTSSLDIRTESSIFTHIFDNYADKTLIVALHRLHVLPQFDVIWVMEKGHLVEQGSFNDLMHKGGSFAHLWHKYQGILSQEKE